MENMKTICHIFYKLNEKSKPVKFFFELTEGGRGKIKTLLDATSGPNYKQQNNNKNPYILFHKGHILNSFKTVDELYYECLDNGNLLMEKKNYENKNEGYRIKAKIGGKDFTCHYILDDFQIISSKLQKLKNQESESDERSCVVCLDNEAEYAFVPCGHLCICSECHNAGGIHRCPLCRGISNNVIKIF